MSQFDQLIDRHGTNSLKHDFAVEKGYPPDVLPLWVADMDFRAPQAVLDALHRKADHGIFGYSDTKQDYYNAAARWFCTRFQWEPQEAWLVKTPGVVFALAMAVRALTGPGECVLIQPPVYYPFSSVVRNNGRTLVTSELVYQNGRYTVDFDDFENKITSNHVKLFLLCSPHNPVGRVWTKEELRRMGEICRRYGVCVVSDEIHCDFAFPEHPHHVFPDLTVEQNVILHGGCIVSADQRESGTFQWDFNEEFIHDTEAMWRISSVNPGIWNYQLTMLDKMQEFAFFSPDGLEMRVNISTAAERHINTRSLYLYPDGVFCQLEREGLLTALENDDVHFYLCFKNEQVKRCLTKAGTILELKTYLIATSLTEQDGSARYNDVMTGVFIDWDGVVHEQSESAVDTENEIDLVLMRGLVPVFVSCKNGAVGEAELYKLNTVASRFGGACARKLLIGTTLGKSDRGKQYFLQRAKDMKIQVLDGVHTLSDEQFRKKLKAFA